MSSSGNNFWGSAGGCGSRCCGIGGLDGRSRPRPCRKACRTEALRDGFGLSGFFCAVGSRLGLFAAFGAGFCDRLGKSRAVFDLEGNEMLRDDRRGLHFVQDMTVYPFTSLSRVRVSRQSGGLEMSRQGCRSQR